MKTADADWELFTDWCTATGHSPATPADLDVFAADLTCSASTLTRRLRTIGRHLGWNQEQPTIEPTVWNNSPELLSLDEALSRCASAGWPDGFRGRRDAWLLVLLAPTNQGGLALTRNAAATLCPADFSLKDFGRHDDPARCPRCVAHRWLHVVGLEHRWSRSAVRAHLATLYPSSTHYCDNQTDDHWREVWTLLPAIDQHGWATDWRPMTTRAITTVLKRRRDRAAPILEQRVAPAESRTYDRPVDDADIVTLLDKLDAVGKSADAVNARVAALLDDTDHLLRRR